ncbi:hypothetical protein [Coleofasciculus sp. FACHB-T130]|uniref:hypothetical protein n=1 Tax=Cyanophyceae TaxID=3028117 RepID=UPI001F554F80|nr:hypothetical protein [Coleofasciculus sp. FACHB-T130]
MVSCTLAIKLGKVLAIAWDGLNKVGANMMNLPSAWMHQEDIFLGCDRLISILGATWVLHF